MEHVKALLIKFISNLVILYIILGLIYNASFGDVFVTTLVLGIVAYIVGDLLILPNSSNAVATISDFIIALVVIYLMTNSLTNIDSPFVASLISSVFVGIFEFIFHKYLTGRVVHDPAHTN